MTSGNTRKAAAIGNVAAGILQTRRRLVRGGGEGAASTAEVGTGSLYISPSDVSTRRGLPDTADACRVSRTVPIRDAPEHAPNVAPRGTGPSTDRHVWARWLRWIMGRVARGDRCDQLGRSGGVELTQPPEHGAWALQVVMPAEGKRSNCDRVCPYITTTVSPACGCPMLPLSSIARRLIVTVPVWVGVHW